jgi:GNAT superfamily N-acetyltransferase
MIRSARPEDVSEILAMIRELAAYERAADQVRAREDDLMRALFGPSPAAFALVAELDDGAVAGFALWFVNYSTWTGSHGIYLEDLFVRPQHRGGGHGKALLAALARLCVERGYQRLEWSVLDWNEPALAFYRSIGAEPMAEWTVHRLAGSALGALGRDPVGDPGEGLGG